MRHIKIIKALFLWLTVLGLISPSAANAVGTWTTLANNAPGGVETMILLPDGTVMAQQGGSSTWYKLTPDSNGSYVNGTWTTRQSMNYTRLYYSSAVLPDGRVFVCGAEYGTGSATAEIYTPSSDSWSTISVPSKIIQSTFSTNSKGNINYGFLDSFSVLLSTSNVLVTPVFPYYNQQTVVYNPIANTWSNAFILNGNTEDEATGVMLPDNSILFVDNGAQTAERFIPSTGTYVNDASCPVQLYDTYGGEEGAAFLLPNGKAFFIGSPAVTALYTPSGNTSAGTWTTGPSIPNGLGQPDAPAAMMFNGKILCALSPAPSSANSIFTTPTSFYEYDYSSGSKGTFTQTGAPGGGSTRNEVTYNDRMLDLPDGTVLFANGASTLYSYQPDGSALSSGTPGVNSITFDANGNVLISGTLFNGISQGACYGDDAQMNSNYPLVRFNVGGSVYYGRTFGWSCTGVATGGKVVSTLCAMPANLPAGNGSLTVIANGIPSANYFFSSPVWVNFNYTGSTQNGSFQYPYKTMAQGVSAAPTNGTIFINASSQPSTSAETPTITKPLTVQSIYGASNIGD